MLNDMHDTESTSNEKRKSFLLINCLNLNGASKPIINYRISCFKAMESMHAIANLERGPIRGYFLGGQIEGCALLGPESDEDIMMINEDITLVLANDGKDKAGEHFKGTQSNSSNTTGLIVECENTPGYVQIMAVDSKTHTPLTEKDAGPLTHLCDIDPRGFLLFNTEKLKARIGMVTPSRFKHGPAMTEKSTNEFYPSDFVYGLYSKAWPKSGNEWLSRNRQYAWPPRKILNLVDDGCFLVPIGSSFDETGTTWRLSFAHIEREMVWTWSVVQYKCFMLLKMIRTNIINPALPGVISSYQLKTLMFWMAEETDPVFWETHSIRECITLLLEKFIEFIQNENCPNYFIRENNLFSGKLSRSSKEELCLILTTFLNNFWSEVFNIPCIAEVRKNLEEGDVECFTDVKTAALQNPRLLQEINNLHFSVVISFATSAMKPAYKLISSKDVDVAIDIHNQYRLLITSLSLINSENLEIEQLLNLLVDLSLGSHLTAKAIQTGNTSYKTEVLQKAEALLKRGCQLDTASGKLKLATMYFYQNNLQSALSIVNQVLSVEDVIPLSGIEPSNSSNTSIAYIVRVLVEQPCLMSTLKDYGALEVVFLPSEIYSAPDPIKFEINRAVFAESEYSIDHPLRWAAFDASFYALLLKFTILHNQNSYENRNGVLRHLREYVKQDNVPFFRRIASLNVVGYCLLLVGEVQWALDVFLGSLTLLKTNNSAAWHLTLLVWSVYQSSHNFNRNI